NKYGSLSVDGGRVTLGWHRNAAGDLVLEWRETGGPAVVAPTRKGFGTTIIDRSVPYDLGGSSSIDYDPKGVEASFRIPARHLSEPRTVTGKTIKYPRPAVGHPQAVPDQLLKGLDVLLVEDSLIIALDAEDIVNRLGASTVTTAATVDGALEQIEAGRPTIAMLDINLGDRNSYPIADRLFELNIPFLFATGYGEQANLPDDHRGRPVVQKPYTIENIARAMDGLLGPREPDAE
ncbi:MAG: response regulator, partial [Caulobacteraceae bacterium]